MSRSQSPWWLIALVAVVLAGTGVTVLQQAALAAYCPDPQEQRFLTLINNYRAQNGVGRLKLVKNLGTAADFHSRDMGRRDFFSHDSSHGTPTDRARRFGYTGAFCCGENIAWGGPSLNADQVFEVWRTSEDGHNEAMLNGSYRAIGIGRYFDSTFRNNGYVGPADIWTTVFGGQPAASPRC